MRIDEGGLSDSLTLPEEVPEDWSEGFVSDDVDDDDDDDDGWVGEMDSVPVADARATGSSIAAASDAKDIPSTLLSVLVAALLSTDDGDAF
jgi:hypothetical protein